MIHWCDDELVFLSLVFVHGSESKNQQVISNFAVTTMNDDDDETEQDEKRRKQTFFLKQH